jgi:uncharacterized RDD family membrane protein YckC
MERPLAILTPEKTILTVRVAGIGMRIGAHLIDVFIVIALEISVAFLITRFPADENIRQGVLMVFMTALPFLYFILFEGLWNGCTPGKKAFSLRVRMIDGTPISFSAAVGRNLLRVADITPPPYVAGLIAMFMTPNTQRLGDLVAGTVVALEKKVVPNFVVAPHRVGIHAFEDHVGALRGMTVEEYNALRRMCDRFPELGASVQASMISQIWQPIATRRNIPLPPANVHPIYLAEATVMKYGRSHGLL